MTRTVVFDQDPFGDRPSDHGPGEKKRKKPGSGATAMKHARAAVAGNWPKVPTLEAQKSIVWIPDAGGPCRSCGRNLTPRSRREDLFGVFDLLVLSEPVVLIQVTTEQSRSQTATARKRKIEGEFLALHADVLLAEYSIPPQLSVWSWVARKHFVAWDWLWSPRVWSQVYTVLSPLLRRGS